MKPRLEEQTPCHSLFSTGIICGAVPYRLEKQTSVPHVKKMKNRRKQNFEGEENNMQLDKEDTRRSN